MKKHSMSHKVFETCLKNELLTLNKHDENIAEKLYQEYLDSSNKEIENEKFHQELLRKTRKHQHSYSVKWVRILAATMTLTTCLLVVAQAYDVNIFRLFPNIGGYSEVRFAPEMQLKSLENLADGIDNVFMPSYVPYGYVLTEFTSLSSSCTSIFTNSKGSIIYLTQILNSQEYNLTVDNDSANTSEVDLAGVVGLLTDDGERRTLSFIKEGYLVTINGNCSNNQIVRLAKSLQ